MPPKSWRQLNKNAPIPSASSAQNQNQLALPSGSESRSTTSLDGFKPQTSSSLSFFDTLTQFADACMGVWPEDKELQSMSEYLKTKKDDEDFKNKLTSNFHETYKDLYLSANKKDVSLFLEKKPLFEELQVAKKMDTATNEVKDTVFEYIRLLVQWSSMHSMYAKCPEKMMSSIAAIASDFSSKIESGTMDFSTLNPLTLGQELMGSMSQDDIENFTRSLMEDGGDNIRNMMSGMVNNLSHGGLANIPGGEGMADMLKSMLNAQSQMD